MEDKRYHPEHWQRYLQNVSRDVIKILTTKAMLQGIA
jgi:hypothetical protein